MSGAWVAKILARHDDEGPVVEATRSGDTWSFGGRGLDTISVRGISENAARRICEELAERAALKVAPADLAAADARRDIAEWLRSQEEPEDESD